MPLDWKFYRDLFSVSWLHIRFTDIFNIAHYAPRFSSGLQTYADWGIILLLAVVGGAIWTFIGKNKKEDYKLTYKGLNNLRRVDIRIYRYR